MVTLTSQNLQSVRPLCFVSFYSLKFPSQISSLKFPIFSPIKTKPTKLSTSKNGSCNSRLVARASVSQFSADMGDILGDVSIFTAAGQSVFFKDLWDQHQVKYYTYKHLKLLTLLNLLKSWPLNFIFLQGIAVIALLRHFGCPCW